MSEAAIEQSAFGRPLESLAFDNRFAALGEAYGSRQRPTSIPAPYLVAFNPAAAALIDLDPAEARRPDFPDFFGGNRLPPGAEPFSQLYAGHQFGNWVGQLGDGRAILLGQVRNRRGESWDVQLKGAGKTPYSRFADGRAVLRSTVREYLAGEAMAGLGIPTTRALCIVGSDAPVYRETRETTAILTRLAPTHVRFGSFEVLYARARFDLLAPLADHVIGAHFPTIAGIEPAAARYRAWAAAVIERTAELIAAWQSVGFCHGVMNTDNMSVAGLTLDYGPFGFMGAFEPGWVCNRSDDAGRYAFHRQPMVALWNLGRFVQALLPLLAEAPEAAVEAGEGLLEDYRGLFDAAYMRRMRGKLGLRTARDGDRDLLTGLLGRMADDGADFTRSFRALGRTVRTGRDAPLADEFADREAVHAWLADYRARLAAEGGDADARAAAMDAVNPKYVLRNYLAQQAIKAAQAGDYGEIERLRRILARPFDEQPGNDDYARLPPDWARRISVGCSS